MSFFVLRKKYDFSSSDNLYQRKITTQLQYIEKIVFLLILLFSFSAILMQFEGMAKVGGGMLASAGVASVVLGFAAQESVSNIIAGFQIAFTQPFRIDDAVVVEDEWGWIEEINLTYIVVRIWDLRRLVLPIKYFTTKPFQNWTRNNVQIIGTVVLRLDYKTPIAKLRVAFDKIVDESEIWDQDIKVLQVINCSEKTLEVRCLISAATSPQAWDLRCEVREKLVDYLQSEIPESLPRYRIAEMSQSL